MIKSAIVITLATLLLSTGQPVGSPIDSATAAAGESSMLVATHSESGVRASHSRVGQVLDCSESGELLAHIPVPSELLLAAVQD